MTVEIFLPILNYNVESWSGTLKRGTRAAQEESLSGLKNPGHDLCLMSAFFRALCTKRIDNTVVGNEAKKSHFLIRTRNLSYEYFYLLFYEKKWDQNSIYFWKKQSFFIITNENIQSSLRSLCNEFYCNKNRSQNSNAICFEVQKGFFVKISLRKKALIIILFVSFWWCKTQGVKDY